MDWRSKRRRRREVRLRPQPCAVHVAFEGPVSGLAHWSCWHLAGARRLYMASRTCCRGPANDEKSGSEPRSRRKRIEPGLNMFLPVCAASIRLYHTSMYDLRTSRRSSDRRPPGRDRTGAHREDQEDLHFVRFACALVLVSVHTAV